MTLPYNPTVPSWVTIAPNEYAPCTGCGIPTQIRIHGAPGHAGCVIKDDVSTVELGATDEPCPESPDRELEAFARLIQSTDNWPDATPSQIRTALATFHQALTVKGTPVHFTGTPAATGYNLYQRLLKLNRGRMVPIEVLTDKTVWNLTKGSNGERVTLPTGFVDTSVALAVGDVVVQTDVNNQYLAVCSIPLGDGDPEHRTGGHRVSDLKLPGYVRVTTAPDLSCVPVHTQGAFRQLTAGSWLPMPAVKYLTGCGVQLDTSDVIVWPRNGERLRVWGTHVRNALATLTGNDLADRMARMAVKAIYHAFMGGWLRSEGANKTELLRPDWNDMVVSTARCNLLRHLDRYPDDRPLAAITDSVMWRGGPPAGLELTSQPGKWKVTRTVTVTSDIVAAHQSGHLGSLNKLMKAEAAR